MKVTLTRKEYVTRYRPDGKVNWSKWIADQEKRIAEQKPIAKIDLSSEDLYRTLKELGEPSYQETVTAAIVADQMLSLGYKLNSSSGKADYETHLLFTAKEKPSIFVRCDLDAISVGNNRYLHNCGHAINITAALVLAKRLSDEGINHVGFIFQPAEEGPGRKEDGYVHPQGFGGGRYLRAKGIYRQILRVISCHIDTSLKPEQVRVSEGQGTAAAYRFTHTANGIPAHAALPWQGKNPIEDSMDFLKKLFELNAEFKKLPLPNYGLVTPSKIATSECELNSLSDLCTIQGISRISGLDALKLFRNFMKENGAEVELEAPPVINDSHLAQLARKTAQEIGFGIVSEPARFRDETAWAGKIEMPWADPQLYPPGCEAILHFFVSGGNNCGYLHAIENFDPSLESINWQVEMLYGIASKSKTIL